MNDESAIVLIVDDDDSVRRSLQRLLRSAGIESRAFASAEEFRAESLPDRPCCLVLDIRMPGMSGLELQEALQGGAVRLPIVFITGHGDVPMSVKAMKAGAADFLQKPFEDCDLLEAIRQATERDRAHRISQARATVLLARVDSLTPREREVFACVVSGALNKQIAFALGITEKTVKVHRAQVMGKMQAESLADLVRMADALGVEAREV